MPVNYVGKPPAVDLSDDVSDIKTAVEDIQAAAGKNIATVTIVMASGDSPTALLTADSTVFKEAGTDITSITQEEIFRFTVDTPQEGVKTVKSLNLDFVWETKIVTTGSGAGESFWEIGEGDSPSSWRRISDVVTATEEVTAHSRSGNFLPTEAASLPFTLRLVGRVFVAGDALRTDILSDSKILLTYEVD